jgi:hypothetical protein
MEAKMKGDQTPWVLCQCDDYWCQIHGQHVFECPCPDIDWWAARQVSPYEPVSEAMVKCVQDAVPEGLEENSGTFRQGEDES